MVCCNSSPTSRMEFPCRDLYEFFKSNHPKYHKYFQEWIANVTQGQIEGFEKQRIGQITQNKHI